MNILEILKNDGSLYNLSAPEKSNLLREIADFADSNSEELYQFVRNINDPESSALSLVYESLSTHSEKHFPFITEQFSNLLKRSLKKSFTEEEADVFLDVDLERFYQYDFKNFSKIVDETIATIPEITDEENREVIIDLLDDFLTEVNPQMHKIELENWKKTAYAETISELPYSQKKMVREVFNDSPETNIVKYLKYFIVFLLVFASGFCYVWLFETKFYEKEIFNYLFFGGGFLLSIFFYWTFSFIKKEWIKFGISMLIFGSISAYIFNYANQQGYLKTLKETFVEIVDSKK